MLSYLRKLLSRPAWSRKDPTAGHVMVQDYLSVGPGTRVLGALDVVRSYAGDASTTQLIFIATWDGRLVGTVSLRDLIFADTNARIGELIRWNLHFVTPSSPAREAVSQMKRYKVPAIAVVDETGHMLGVIWADRIAHYLKPNEV